MHRFLSFSVCVCGGRGGSFQPVMIQNTAPLPDGTIALVARCQCIGDTKTKADFELVNAYHRDAKHLIGSAKTLGKEVTVAMSTANNE